MLTDFTITEKVYDLLVVNILNEKLQYESFEYVIYSANETLLRKGCFRAPSVQIRTNFMNMGTYHLQLLHKGEEWKTSFFKKQIASTTA
jgi:hypothetical protein